MKLFSRISVLLIILALLNYVSRKWMPAVYTEMADYNSLYLTDAGLYVSDTHVYHDSLELRFGGAVPPAPRQFTLHVYPGNNTDTTFETIHYNGDHLRYKPAVAGPTHAVAVTINNSDSFVLNIGDITPQNNSGEHQYELLSRDLVIKPKVVHPLQAWTTDFWFTETRVPVSEVQKLLHDSVMVLDQDSTVDKVLKISSFILKRIAGHLGIPPDSFAGKHPLQQLYDVQNKGAKVWCGNISALFSCLASVAGVPVRAVQTGDFKDNIGSGIHVFCEVYIREKRCWSYVDLTMNAVLPTDGKRYLNGLDIQRLLTYGGTDTVIRTLHYANDSLASVPFTVMAQDIGFYLHRNTVFNFSYGRFLDNYNVTGWKKQLINFFNYKPYYAIYSDNATTTCCALWLRVVLNYALAFALLIWIILGIVKITAARKR